MIHDTGYRLQDTGYRIQDTGYRLQDTGYRSRISDWKSDAPATKQRLAIGRQVIQSRDERTEMQFIV